MSKFIKKGNPNGKTDLVTSIIKGLATEASVSKRSVHGADAAFCARKSVLHLAIDDTEKQSVDPTSTLYFVVGNAIHDAVQVALNKAGLLLANEMKIEYGPIRGFIDDVIISSETGGLKIIDVKTCGQLPSQIKPGQAEQLYCYALLTGIQEASIIYVSRSVANFNGIMIKEIPAPVNQTTMSQTAQVVAQTLVFHANKIVVPKPDYRVTESGCGWCPFKKNGCWGREDGIRPLLSGFKYQEIIDADMKLEIATLADKLLKSKENFYNETIDKNPKLKKWSEAK